jgi:hypothetical protein
LDPTITYLGVLADGEVDVNFADNATTTKLAEWGTDSFLDITTQSRRQVNVVAIHDQVNVGVSFWLCSYLKNSPSWLVRIVRACKGASEVRE